MSQMTRKQTLTGSYYRQQTQNHSRRKQSKEAFKEHKRKHSAYMDKGLSVRQCGWLAPIFFVSQ